MEKLQISQILRCNRVIYKLIENQKKFPICIGFNLYKISKTFNEVEEYIFEVMNMTFGEFSFENMTQEQQNFFNKLLTEIVEVDFEKIPLNVFEENDELKLNMKEIADLSVVLEEK